MKESKPDRFCEIYIFWWEIVTGLSALGMYSAGLYYMVKKGHVAEACVISGLVYGLWQKLENMEKRLKEGA